jgi:hypothetical protein
MDARVLEIRRYPVKALQGEVPHSADVEKSGLAGDRSHALLDVATGKLASAKDPRLWTSLLGLRAVYAGNPAPGEPLVIEQADGERVRSDEPGVHDWLSRAAGRAVQLVATTATLPGRAAYDDVWPEIPDLAPQAFIDATKTSATAAGEPVSTLPAGMLAPGTFQDLAPITLLTTASLRAAAKLHPSGRWDPRRFRSNLLLELAGEGFLENAWVGRQLALGDVVLELIAATPRCIMTTLAQQDLPADREILRTVARHNRVELKGSGRFACLGVYASVVTPGRVAVGDSVRLL